MRSARGPYTKLTPAQRLTIGKRVAEHSTMATMKYFAKKYPGEFGSLKRPQFDDLRTYMRLSCSSQTQKAEDLNNFH